jgi:Lrp/AsnC family transcriptional regulator, leucine-responsive regulatory protein
LQYSARRKVDLSYFAPKRYKVDPIYREKKSICMENAVKPVDLDEYDRKILDVLREDGRITVTDLAQRIGLSKTPCQQRLKRLIDNRVIIGFTALIDPAKLALDHVAFTEVKLSDTREKALEEFNAAVRRIPEVEECHMIASSFDYLLKVRTADIRKYRIVLGERISSLPHVASTSTYISMETIRETVRG